MTAKKKKKRQYMTDSVYITQGIGGKISKGDKKMDTQFRLNNSGYRHMFLKVLYILTDYYLWIDHWRGTPPKFEVQCQVNCVEPWIHSGSNHKIYCKDDIYKIKIRHFPQSTGFENSLLIDYFLEDH